MGDKEDIRKDAAPEEEMQKVMQNRRKRKMHRRKTDRSEEGLRKRREEDTDTRYLRLMADFQNYKRRAEKEKSEIYVLTPTKSWPFSCST